MNLHLLPSTVLLTTLSISMLYPETEPHTNKQPGEITTLYKVTAERIVESVMAGNDAYAKLETLCLDIGHRLSGSDNLERAVKWTADAMRADGQENVRLDKVMVPHWVRGNESATMISPRRQSLAMLGLGGSVGTPEGGITAPVIVVADEDELNAVGDAARGKIVLFNKVMPPYDPEKGSGYGETVKYRTQGARLAAARGAVAALVRSVTANSLYTPHTGAMGYGDAEIKIPAAAITVEDAEAIARLTKRGTEVVMNLKMDAKTLPDAESANVIGELRGTSNPEEIVVIGGHLDSWDVGHGAHDDGGGCIIAMEAINVLRKLDLRPRRTIRVVLFTNEENGLRGGKAYAEDHKDELANHVAAIETDSGVFAPRGLSVGCEVPGKEAVAIEQVREMMSLFPDSFTALETRTGGGGADIGPMRSSGAVLMGHDVEGSRYFNYHHTPADTIDKVDPIELSQNVAVLAVVAYIIADMPDRLGELTRPSDGGTGKSTK